MHACDSLLLYCFLWSACSAYTVRVYRYLGETTREVLSYSTYLTGWVTHDPSTAVRATTSLSGERAHLTMLILSPLTGFLSRSLFHNSPLSCGERMFSDGSHDFSRQISPLSVLCSIMEVCGFGCCMEGDGEGGKRGTGGENPEGEGGLQPGCPPSPGLSPQDIGKPVLRMYSTQTIKDTPGKDGR